MRADKILLFFITVICFFCAAGFAGDVRGASTSRVGSTLTVHDALTSDFGILTAAGPSGMHIISGARNDQGSRTSEVFKILSVMEGRIEDPKLIQKVKDKLSTLREDRLRMVVSLSERVADGDCGVETDIAFFLLTTLIIFS